MEADLLEVDRADAAGGLVDLLQLGPEAEEDHPTALEPPRLELDRAAGDGAIGVAHSPAGLLAEVQRRSGRGSRCTRRISSFGEDEAGEVYVVDLGGAVYRIVSATE